MVSMSTADGYVYSLTVEYKNARNARYHSRVRNRWVWRVVKQKIGEKYYYDSPPNIHGHSIWRWKAVWKANRALRKVQNGIHKSTSLEDLNTRISALEKELRIGTC